MKIPFYKYHGTGNDFILIDNRKIELLLSGKQIKQMCNRHFGIGADGLMTLNYSEAYNFEMKYYNSDGNEGSMCGNGGRCIALFAHHLGIIKESGSFIAIDGEHDFVVHSATTHVGKISIKMGDVEKFVQMGNEYFLDTGSPHLVRFCANFNGLDAFAEGKQIRWEERFQPDGTNVNFVMQNKNNLKVRTFERGVEDITLSCGTGVVAAALAASSYFLEEKNEYVLETNGGKLNVKFKRNNIRFEDIWLKGEAAKVFEGIIEI